MSAPNGYAIVKAVEKVSDDEPHGWIQWKGTQVCIDLHCACGTHGHLDVDFFMYQVKCKDCGRHYVVGQNVVLAEMTPEQVAEAGDATFYEFSEGK